MSQDARNWARIEAGHHTGALFEAGEGPAGAWDAAFIAGPQVSRSLNLNGEPSWTCQHRAERACLPQMSACYRTDLHGRVLGLCHACSRAVH